MKKLFTTIAVALITLAASAQQKYVGGDISLLTQYEDHGALYYDVDGTTAITELLPYFKNQGMNAMRVRLFVDPSKAPKGDPNTEENEQGQGVCQDIEYVKALGKRIKDAGFAFMLDFHYSDSWADPVKQYTPDAWLDLTNEQLYTKIYEYTKESLKALVAAGAQPDMIQIGNEISYGMLWGKRATGDTKYSIGVADDNATRFFNLLSNASKACREVTPDAQIIIHTELIRNLSLLKSYYNDVAAHNIDYDVIGLSYYPYYHGALSQLELALRQMESDHKDKKIMIVETGYFHKYQPDVTYDLSGTYEISEAGQKAFTEAMIETLNKHDNVLGLFWWMMEANEKGLDWNTKRVTDGWYNAGLFDNDTGKAMSAITVLKDFLEGSDGISSVTVDAAKTKSSKYVYSIDGRIVSSDGTTDGLAPGLYIHNGMKVVVKR